MLKNIKIIKKYVDDIEKYANIIEKNKEVEKTAGKVRKVYKAGKKGVKVLQSVARGAGKGGIYLGTAMQHPIAGPAILGGGLGGAFYGPRIKEKAKETYHKSRYGGYYSY